MIDFLQGVGAEPVSMNFSEVVTALHQRVIDCVDLHQDSGELFP